MANETYNELVTEHKPLSTKLKEMGFSENTFMVIGKYDKLDVADGYDQTGHLKKSEYLSFDPQKYTKLNDYDIPRTEFDRMDEAIEKSQGGRIPAGGLGSNNGIYTAKAFQGGEMIITKDPEIYYALRDKLHFAEDVVETPLSNGGTIMDPKQSMNFQRMEYNCKAKADSDGIEKRTAAVQRGDIITTYDPTDKEAGGDCYKNVRHYEKMPNGSFKAISMYEASNKLKLNLQHASNQVSRIDSAQKLDGLAVQKILSNRNNTNY